MHASSYRHMARAVETYLAAKAGTPLTVIDIGAYDVNASYRPLFDRPGWSYRGSISPPARTSTWCSSRCTSCRSNPARST